MNCSTSFDPPSLSKVERQRKSWAEKWSSPTAVIFLFCRSPKESQRLRLSKVFSSTGTSKKLELSIRGQHDSVRKEQFMRVTECECTQAGWCERHQCMKSSYLFQFCRRSTRLFRNWEEGNGPGQHIAFQSVRTVVDHSCRHLGDSVREQKCSSCRGAVRLKVFHCAIHAECTIGKQLEGVTCCIQCTDYHQTERQ